MAITVNVPFQTDNEAGSSDFACSTAAAGVVQMVWPQTAAAQRTITVTRQDLLDMLELMP